MNTQVKVIAWTDKDELTVKDYFSKAIQEIQRIEKLYTRFQKDSYLSSFNNRKFTVVTKEFFQIALFLFFFASKSEDYFDPTIIDFLEAYGYGPGYHFEKLNNEIELKKSIEKLKASRPSIKDTKFKVIQNGIEKFKFSIDEFQGQVKNDLKNLLDYEFKSLIDFVDKVSNDEVQKKIEADQFSTKTFRKKLLGPNDQHNLQFEIILAQDQRIEFGGCGKGYAIDRMYHILEPLENFVIDIGGDIRCCGQIEERNWTTSIYGTSDAIAMLSGDVVCVSGKAARQVGNFHHLLNPKDANPTGSFDQILVYASYKDTCNLSLLTTFADAYSTLSYVSPIEKNMFYEVENKGVYKKYINTYLN
ncbi:FAD:protein FMN transferase [bacterium]|nr:MAG: FAD:protein FMN transferase [bacterium]